MSPGSRFSVLPMFAVISKKGKIWLTSLYRFGGLPCVERQRAMTLNRSGGGHPCESSSERSSDSRPQYFADFGSYKVLAVDCALR